ncbi:MAG TPA: hypothetical protein VM888_11660 [Chitinophagaceae bacterium]|nr:hypothetical protein [Chitinophagaceae bacterium]
MQYLKNSIKKRLAYFLYRNKVKPEAFEKLLLHSVQVGHKNSSAAVADLFTYHGEDGIIQYIISKLKDLPPVFVDIGSGNCITSNCATLTVHNKWSGLFLDNNDLLLSIGNSFYSKLNLGDKLQFAKELVTPENINGILKQKNIRGPVGLLSIDIDGNDYWVWKALNIIQPQIVVIEAKVEFGFKNIIVPEGPKNHHSFNKKYNGASVEAFRALGYEKGYTLVGANPQGYNLFFIRNEDVNESLQELKTESILKHPDTVKSFYPEHFFKQHQFIKIKA